MILQKQKYRLLNIYYSLFKENFKKKLDFDWSKYPTRYEIIQKLIDKKKYLNYLEIGCFKNDNFDKIKAKKKVGVDPISGGNVRLTSDDFFKINKDFFDIIFIDGLHIFEQVRKDILNSLNLLNPNGMILLHDCLPSKNRDQMVPRSHENWNGDVWKAIVECRTLKNIDTYTCLADQGLGIIFKRPNQNSLDLDVSNFKEMKFKDYYINYKSYMNIIEVDKLLSM